MPAEKKILATSEIWRTAVATLKATRHQSCWLLTLGLIVPQVGLNLGLDWESGPVVKALRAVFTSKPGGTGSPLGFTELIAPGLTFFGQLLLWALAVALPLLAAFLALVHTVVDHHRGEPARGPWRAWLAGLRSALPAAVLMFSLSFVLLLTGQLLVVPALLVAILGLMAPVLLVAERRGIFRTLWSALTLQYAKGGAYWGWTVFFNLISLSAFLYAALAGTGLLAEGILFMDEHLNLGRGLWVMTVPGTPMTAVYLGVSVFESVVSMLLLACLPALTGALYFTVRGSGEGRTIARA